MSKKIFVVDTSVLLHDMHSIHSFDDNEVVIPVVVLDELDRFKDKPSLLGSSARYVNRFLDRLREHGNLQKGVCISNLPEFESEQMIRVELEESFPETFPKSFNRDKGDNFILACALVCQKENPDKEVVIVTKDINLRVKADSLRLKADDYLADHIDIAPDDFYSGISEASVLKSELDRFHKEGKIPSEDHWKLLPYQGVLLTSDQGGSGIGVVKGNAIHRVQDARRGLQAFEPRNKEQGVALELLSDPECNLVSISGIAGSGKTFITLASAMQQVLDDRYKRIVITRSIQPVGKDLGFLPGDMKEKMMPWLAPIADNFKHAFKDQDNVYFEQLLEKGTIEIAPLSYIRGRTFNDSFVIVDEAQNATIHELKTIITRVGKSSKVVLLGDTDQIDTPYINSYSNGLTNVIEKMKHCEFAGHITLKKGQRSRIANYAADHL